MLLAWRTRWRHDLDPGSYILTAFENLARLRADNNVAGTVVAPCPIGYWGAYPEYTHGIYTYFKMPGGFQIV